ncbi:uncharacterized protein MONOS_7113 [Monocercomonoides exilis]|uniref:uncharacterized protein n=1 Tax=Monocercomonoides exilis TaxID=2049356 RepID=UPI003559A40E|nr:hypothetical protein MONOS_7113 [Monocercomonoides exilis]|eukprot:MONOS_7113.1-p1 / transcript=MONOS_7113.1 / gene=MONOS_7113 / organism=Monocercomonoides_exilis_PA203 / gene_product=unspecified product / transcript_product=unspecified product / location=Mono_scaffold00236:55934-56392(-) / protein_length=153 / sequence_SO=supercontig / SO=protein_coding / is_pseudo=false
MTLSPRQTRNQLFRRRSTGRREDVTADIPFGGQGVLLKGVSLSQINECEKENKRKAEEGAECTTPPGFESARDKQKEHERHLREGKENSNKRGGDEGVGPYSLSSSSSSSSSLNQKRQVSFSRIPPVPSQPQISTTKFRPTPRQVDHDTQNI